MSGYAPLSLIWLGQQLENLIPSAVVSGIVAGPYSGDSYHQAAKDVPASSYTRLYEADRVNIDANASCALDVSMSTADMTLITARFHRSWKDQNDPRLNDTREIIGTLDGTNVIYMDCQSGQQSTADDSHLWHLHIGGMRRPIITLSAMSAVLSVARGETYAQYLNSKGESGMGDDYGRYGRPGPIEDRTTAVMIADLWNQERAGVSPYDEKTATARSAQLARIEAYAKTAATVKTVTLDPATIAQLAEAIAKALPKGASARDIAAELISQLADAKQT